MKKYILNSVPKGAILIDSMTKQGVKIYIYSLIYRLKKIDKGDIWTITEYEEEAKRAIVAQGNGFEIPPSIQAVKMKVEDIEGSKYHHESTNLIDWQSRLGHH